MSIDICQELHQNFIDYSDEVNRQRAFPDARDGLKPGQRACLWEFFDKGYLHKKPHVKSAKVSGGVIANYWPHGDAAIYETFARMSQNWIENIPEVEWHGNNGNLVTGPEPAAARYTEARLSLAAEHGMFRNINKNVVRMIPNYSEDMEWPEVLPSIFPRLMVNGSQGIGSTIANNWLLFNLTELSQVIVNYIEKGILDYSTLYPDFPSGGILINKEDIHTIHETGKGKAILRGKAEIKDNHILITELPYQVYIEPLIEDVKDLIRKEKLSHIEDILNKSDKKRILIDVECEKGYAERVLEDLYALTDLQKTYNANQMALIGKQPIMFTLKDYIDTYVEHNLDCIQKEYEFELEKTKARLEIVEGLLKAIENIDNIIVLIKKSENSTAAKEALKKTYDFTEAQAKAITGMRLGSLAKLEGVELGYEKEALLYDKSEYENILSSKTEQTNILVERLELFTKDYGFKRRTQVTQINLTKPTKERVVKEPEKCVVVLTEAGNIKRIPTTSFRTQNRAGKGIKTQDDITSMVLRTNTEDSLMVFTNMGNMYRILVDDIPEGTNSSKGVSVRSLISFQHNEYPQTIYSIYKDTDAEYVFFITKNGTVKKTLLEEFTKTRKKTGLATIKLREGDSLAAVTLIKDEPIIIFTKNGMSIKINSTDLSAAGRTTIGIKGITLKDGDEALTALPVRDTTDNVAVFAKNGNGARYSLEEFPAQTKGGKGSICYKGELAAATLVNDADKVLIIGDKSSICIAAKDIPLTNKKSNGNIIIKDNNIKSVTKV